MANRDKQNGQYAHSNLDILCRCGHALGVHTAAVVGGQRPCLNHDTGAECNCFKFKRNK